MGESLDVLCTRQIDFSLRLQTANPAPGKRIGCGVSIKEMTHEEVRTELPWQAQRMNPDTRKPHSDMVVKITRPAQFRNPVIETFEARLSSLC